MDSQKKRHSVKEYAECKKYIQRKGSKANGVSPSNAMLGSKGSEHVIKAVCDVSNNNKVPTDSNRNDFKLNDVSCQKTQKSVSFMMEASRMSSKTKALHKVLKADPRQQTNFKDIPSSYRPAHLSDFQNPVHHINYGDIARRESCAPSYSTPVTEGPGLPYAVPNGILKFSMHSPPYTPLSMSPKVPMTLPAVSDVVLSAIPPIYSKQINVSPNAKTQVGQTVQNPNVMVEPSVTSMRSPTTSSNTNFSLSQQVVRLRSQLPPNWRMTSDPEGRVYYYHIFTRKTQWNYPNDTKKSFSEADSSNGVQTISGVTQALADTSSLKVATKLKELFRSKMYNYVVRCLKQYRYPDYPDGKITCTDDLKYLAKKLTHIILKKELKLCGEVEKLECSKNVKSKVNRFIITFMDNCGPVYTPKKYQI